MNDSARRPNQGASVPPCPAGHDRSRREGGSAGHGLGVTTMPDLVSVVDDDESVREALPDLLRELGFDVAAFASAEEFLTSERIALTRCLVLDIGMPGMSGPDLQDELLRRGAAPPIVFITAQQDSNVRSRVLAAGAVACLFKPFSDTALLAVVNAAIGERA